MVDPPPTDPGPFRRLAERHLPTLPLRRVVAHNGGWGCFVLEVNGEWILRFPRTAADAARVEREARLLRALERRVPVPIPHFRKIVRGPGRRILFVVYPKIPGRHLPAAPPRTPAMRAWADDLGRLLRALDRFPRDLGRRLGVTGSRRTERIARWGYLYPRVRRIVHPLLPADVRRQDRAYWEDYMTEARLAARPTVLTHGDLSAEHIFVDGDHVTGVIDWESASFDDGVGDVTMLPRANGFFARVAAARFGNRDPDWPRRWAFHRHAVPVYSILYALEHGDRHAVRVELARYRRSLPR